MVHCYRSYFSSVTLHFPNQMQKWEFKCFPLGIQSMSVHLFPKSNAIFGVKSVSHYQNTIIRCGGILIFLFYGIFLDWFSWFLGFLWTDFWGKMDWFSHKPLSDPWDFRAFLPGQEKVKISWKFEIWFGLILQPWWIIQVYFQAN